MTTIKTFEDFIKDYSSNPELHKKTWKAGQLDWDENFLDYPNDYYAANTGAVTGMIYYADTVKFAKANHLEILQALEEFEKECGKLDNKPSTTDETQYFNWMAWFAWENMMSEILSYLEA